MSSLNQADITYKSIKSFTHMYLQIYGSNHHSVDGLVYVAGGTLQSSFGRPASTPPTLQAQQQVPGFPGMPPQGMAAMPAAGMSPLAYVFFICLSWNNGWIFVVLWYIFMDNLFWNLIQLLNPPEEIWIFCCTKSWWTHFIQFTSWRTHFLLTKIFL